MSLLLPLVTDRNHYKILFSQNHIWEPAIDYLKNKYQLEGEPKRGTLGSHIVYRVGAYWIKLMAPLFAKDMIYEIAGLNSVYEKLSVATPHILAHGQLENWTYIIISHIEGEPLRQVWSKFSDHDKSHLTNQLAQITKEISHCTPDETIIQRFEWNHFITEQFKNCETQQTQKGLPTPWLNHLKKFLSTFDIEEFTHQKPNFIHADLTYDHFLITQIEKPKISGLIDLADCQIGHPEYEIVAPCTFILKSHKKLLRQYLKKFGLSENQLNDRFSEKLLVWAILHRYFSLITYFENELKELTPGDFAALAKKVYPL